MSLRRNCVGAKIVRRYERTVMERSRAIRVLAFVTTFVLAVIMLLAQSSHQPAQALPEFSRQYGVPCSTCHASPPELNKMGLAFQANYFNWPGGAVRPQAKGYDSLPITFFANSTYSNDEGGSPHDAQFDNMWLTAANGFSLNGSHKGGYWFEYEIGENDGSRPGNLGNAFAAVPIAGPSGQLALSVGQFGPFDYQYGDAAYLSQTTIQAIDAGDNGIMFDAPTPQLALQYYDNRGKLTANGNYVNAGVPFGGYVDLNTDSRLYSAQGGYVHAFRRDGYTTNGLFAYREGRYSFEGLIATKQPWQALRILAAASTGTDAGGTLRHLSIQGDYVLTPDLAAVARYETIRGVQRDEYPVFSINWYPASQRILRLTAETVQDSGARNNTIYATLQY
jgi:hypothetical protein